MPWDQCDKKFKTSQEKKWHDMTHSGEKPFGCAYCDKKFIFSNQKKEHERIHTGEKTIYM